MRLALEQEIRKLVSPLEEPGQPPVRTRVEPGIGRIADYLVALAEEEKVTCSSWARTNGTRWASWAACPTTHCGSRRCRC